MSKPVVIVLEDNEFSVNVIHRSLALAGYDCAEAQTEQEALELCKVHGDNVKALIADLILPDCRGTDVAIRIAAIRPGLPTLFVSGTPQEIWPLSDYQKMCALPADTTAFVAKPFLPRTLLDQLSHVLEGRSQAPDTRAPVPSVR